MSEAVVLALVALASSLVGGSVWSFLAKWIGRDEPEIKRLREDVKATRDEAKGALAAQEKCEGEMQELRHRMAVIEHHHVSHLSRWVKDAHKRVIWVNHRALISIFAPLDLGRDDVEGKTFTQLFDEQVAKEFDRLDHAALAHPGSAFSTLIKLHPDLPVMQVVKVAAVGREGELIYEGYAFHTNEPDIALAVGLARNLEQRAVSIDNLSEDAKRR